MTGPTSENFSYEELACVHCGVNGCKLELVDALEKFRAYLKRPIKVLSAYRCAIHNTEVGGAPQSQHVLGKAADIMVSGMTAAELEVTARQIFEIKGIGRDDLRNYIHVDVRDFPARWCYAASGVQEPWYPPKPAVTSAAKSEVPITKEKA